MKNKNAGFTLVEVMACLAIASVLIMMAGTLLLFSNQTAAHYAASMDNKEIGDAISRTVKKQLEYTEWLRISNKDENISEGEREICFSKEGRLIVGGEDLYGDTYYGNRTVGCRIIVDSGNKQTMQIKIYIKDKDGTQRYQRLVGMRFCNMELKNKEIVYHSAVVSDGIIDSEHQDVYLYYGRSIVREG